jgi:hypothetical protein
MLEKTELLPVVADAPPEPTVTVYAVPTFKDKRVPLTLVSKPPAPPPPFRSPFPPTALAPPPAPATTKYSTPYDDASLNGTQAEADVLYHSI